MNTVILPVPFSNPLAQRWRLASFESARVNRYWRYGKTFTVAAGTTVFNQSIPIQGGADFLWRENAFGIGASAPGKIFARFRDGNGKRMSKDLLSVEELRGPIAISQLLPRTSQVFVDIQNTGVGSIDVQVILKGVNLYQPLGINTAPAGFEPEEYVPLWATYSIPPAGWHDEPFDYYFELAAASLQVQNGVPLQMDSDADFYWRGVTGFSSGNGLQQLIWRDAWDNQLSSDFVTQGNELGVAPNCRPLNPEVCCPAYSTLAVSATEYATATTTLKFALRGVKRFRN